GCDYLNPRRSIGRSQRKAEFGSIGAIGCRDRRKAGKSRGRGKQRGGIVPRGTERHRAIVRPDGAGGGVIDAGQPIAGLCLPNVVIRVVGARGSALRQTLWNGKRYQAARRGYRDCRFPWSYSVHVRPLERLERIFSDKANHVRGQRAGSNFANRGYTLERPRREPDNVINDAGLVPIERHVLRLQNETGRNRERERPN